MALSIDWATKVITVPKADMTLIQTVPFEVRELNTDDFRLELKEIEATFDGMAFEKTHVHNPPFFIGGTELARTIEIVNGYTVTFEDGQYAVNLQGSNSNIGDVINVNQVSVRSANSAGLVTSAGIEQIEYGAAVWVDQIGGVAGIGYPKGTPRRPVNNMDDAYAIAQNRGFKKIRFIGDYTFSSTDMFLDLEFEGDSEAASTITLASGSLLGRCEFSNMTIKGASTGFTLLERCILDNLTAEGIVASNVDVVVKDCLFRGTITVPSNYTGQLRVLNCYSDVAGMDTPVLDMQGADANFIFRNYSGGVQFDNLTAAGQNYSVDLHSGQVVIDASCTQGEIVVRGVGKVTNNGSITMNSSALVEADKYATKADVINASQL